MRILQLELTQIDKIFNSDVLDKLTQPYGIGKNTEKAWILDTRKQTNFNNINQFLFAANVREFLCVMIKKPPIKGA